MLKTPDLARKEKIIEIILAADPTNEKRFSLWLATLLNRGSIDATGLTDNPNAQLRLPEDNPKAHEVLLAYQKAIPRLPPEQRDVTRFKDFNSLEETIDKLVQVGRLGVAFKVRQVPGAEIVYNVPPYTVYLIKRIKRARKGERSEEDGIKIKAVETLGMGPPETRWCTKAAYSDHRDGGSMAEYHLSKADVYVVYKNGQPFLQKRGREIMDANNSIIDIPPELEVVLDKPRENIDNFPKGLSLKESTLITTAGNRIPCTLIIDPEKFYFYYAVDPITVFGSMSRKKDKLSRLGIYKYKRNPDYFLPEWYKLRSKYEEYKSLLLRRIGSTPGQQRSTEELRSLYAMFTEIKKKLQAGPKRYLIEGPRSIKTINKENVADILDASGRSLRVTTPVQQA